MPHIDLSHPDALKVRIRSIETDAVLLGVIVADDDHGWRDEYMKDDRGELVLDSQRNLVIVRVYEGIKIEIEDTAGNWVAWRP